MRKRCNDDSILGEPPEKRSLTASPSKSGSVLVDILGKKWKLGRPIGTGAFGEIYLASDDMHREVTSDAPYVAKVETHASGPLFVERNCYLLCAKEEMIDDWKATNKLNHLGMPHYVASGSHCIGGSKYRFLILPRFEKDLEDVFEAKKRKFNLKTVLTIALQTLDVLQYIHSKGFVHSDVKASNILLERSKKKPLMPPIYKLKVVKYHGCMPIRSCKVRKICHALRPQHNIKYMGEQRESIPVNHSDIDRIFLLDYGLAAKYLKSNGEHKEFCSDVRKAHAGTVLFCSRDAHEGAQARRSDLECLGYNLIYWLTSNLPWSGETDLEKVHREKTKCFDNLRQFLDYVFAGQCPRFLFDYFVYLQKLSFCEQPDYKYCKALFKAAVKEYGYKDNLLLDFDNLEGWGRKQKKVKCQENAKEPRAALKLPRSPLRSNLPVVKRLRKKTKGVKKIHWSKLVDPEVIMKRVRERKMTESSDGGLPPPTMTSADLQQLNPTEAMREAFNRMQERNAEGMSPKYRHEVANDRIEGYTPAMMEVYNRMKDREELERLRQEKSRSRSSSKTRVGRPRKKPKESPQRTRARASKKEVKQPPRKSYSLRG